MAIYAVAIIPLLFMLVDQAEQLPGKRTKLVCLRRRFYWCWLSHKSVTLMKQPYHIRSTIWVPPRTNYILVDREVLYERYSF